MKLELFFSIRGFKNVHFGRITSCLDSVVVPKLFIITSVGVGRCLRMFS